MAGGAETPNIAALPAIARLGACESARGPDADRHVKLLIQFAVEGSLSGAYSQPDFSQRLDNGPMLPFNCVRCGACWINIQMPEGLRSFQLPNGFMGEDPAPHFARSLAHGLADAANSRLRGC